MSRQIVILGAAGRMGRAIARCLLNEAVQGLTLGGAVDAPGHPEQGADMGTLAGCPAAGIPLAASLDEVVAGLDVAIDFSVHEAASRHATTLAAAGKPMVIGTTGLNDAEQAALASAAESIALVMAPNMSLGVNLLMALAERAATSLKGKGYDVEIIERHHRHKMDAPSGTALGFGEAVARGLSVDLEEVARHGREGQTGERTAEEIGMHAIRGGDIVGDHTVLFATPGEIVELSHRATHRDTFALGALRAAAWVADKPPGLYSMKDVLGL